VATKALRGKKRAELVQHLNDGERIYLEELLPTHDGVEGIQAFMDKRQPVWRNA